MSIAHLANPANLVAAREAIAFPHTTSLPNKVPSAECS